MRLTAHVEFINRSSVSFSAMNATMRNSIQRRFAALATSPELIASVARPPINSPITAIRIIV
jgi:hypothetical protein